MARNLRPTPANKPGRAASTPVLPSCTESATPSQLRAWLTTPPSSEVASAWRRSPWPLKRAVELEDRALFRDWCEWGCSSSGGFMRLAKTSSLVEVLSHEARRRCLQWVLEDQPRDFSVLLGQLRANSQASVFHELDWPRILASPHLDDRTARRLATEALFGIEGAIPPVAALSRTGGKLVKDYELPDIVYSPTSRLTSPRSGWSFTFDPKSDRAIATRIQSLPDHTPLEFSPGQLASLGAFFAALALLDRLEAGTLNVPTKRGMCRNYETLFNGWNAAATPGKGVSQPSEIWVEQAVRLLAHLDFRSADTNKSTPLHVAHLSHWPKDANIQLLQQIVELRPAALSQKNKKGEVPNQSSALPIVLREWLDSYERRRQLDQTLRHQVARTEAIKEALNKAPAAAPPRRM